MKSVQQQSVPSRESKKYTVREVLDSLYWTLLDEDEEPNGHLNLISTLSGESERIPISEIFDYMNKHPNGK